LAINLIIFDLDGTLVDSTLDLANSVNATREFCGLPRIDTNIVASYVGNGAPVLIQRALGPDASAERIQEALTFFLENYRQHMLDHTRLYPGVRESLDRLKANGVKMCVLTNKPVRFSRDILAGLGVAAHFFQVYGGNSFETKKPDPMGVNALLAEAGATKPETLIVGDSAVDVLTARNAGVAVCGVTYGFQPETLEEQPPDFKMDRMEQVAEMVIAGRNSKGGIQS
jgi:phosphoglycolate phosphatase